MKHRSIGLCSSLTLLAFGCLLLFCFSSLVGCQCNSAPPAPPTPQLSEMLQISLRSSLLDASTAVLQIQNNSSRTLKSLSISFHSDDTNQKKTHRTGELVAWGRMEVGVLESSWYIEPNETIEISCTGHGSVKYKTFRTDKGTVGIRKALW